MAFANRPTVKKKTAKKKVAKMKKHEKKPESKRPTAGGFPKIVTDAKIQTVTYDATSGANIKFKEFTMTSGQLEKLTAIAMDGRARVRLSIEEINPTFDAAQKQRLRREPMFVDVSDKKVGKKTQKKTDKKTDGKKGKEPVDDGSKLPI